MTDAPLLPVSLLSEVVRDVVESCGVSITSSSQIKINSRAFVFLFPRATSEICRILFELVRRARESRARRCHVAQIRTVLLLLFLRNLPPRTNTRTTHRAILPIRSGKDQQVREGISSRSRNEQRSKSRQIVSLCSGIAQGDRR